MKYRRKLFMSRNIFDLQASDGSFTAAMKANIAFHARKCPEYRAVLDALGFDTDEIKSARDLPRIPPLPNSFLKNKTLLSKPYKSLPVKTTSSGTSGMKTLSGFDVSSGICWLFMALRLFRFHKMLSFRRTNYIILGYKPGGPNKSATAKALRASALLAPAKKIEYALIWEDGDYRLNTDGLIRAIKDFGAQNRPVRIIGFPAYLKIFLDELDNRGIKLNLHKDSLIMLGGGWKTFFAQEISKEELFIMAKRVLGVRRENFKDHFSTAEHPINYVSCSSGRFHVPAFSRVIIRDVRTLEPVPFGTPGLLNLITPLLSSAPYGSILTDDIAVMTEKCGCGCGSPCFELIGRVGMASIRTCTQAASEFLNKI